MMRFTGLWFGITNIVVYIGGMPEHIANTRYGTWYVPAQPAGGAGRKIVAEMAFTVAGIGVVIGSAGWRLGKKRKEDLSE